MTFKQAKTKRVKKAPDSPAQAAVKLYGQRMFATGSTSNLIKHLKELGYTSEAVSVEIAVVALRVAAQQEYEAKRLALDPNFETASMRRAKLLKELEAEESAIQHNQWR